MTDAELRAFVVKARAEVDAALAELETVDPDALPLAQRAQYDEFRQRCLDLQASTTDEAIEAELDAMAHAGRELTPAEAAALLIKQ